MKAHRFTALFLSAVLLAAASALPAFPRHQAQGTTFTVTKTADTNDGACDADCSLREAIIAANTNPEKDAIALPAGTYVLSIAGTDEDAGATGDLDITTDLEIRGADATTSIIDGGGIDRVLHVLNSAHVDVTDVTIRGGTGAAGAGINTTWQSVLALTNCTVTANSTGGGIANGGTLTLADCTVSDNSNNGDGGGIAGGTVTIENSTVSGNLASNGGGISTGFYGAYTIRNSAIINNRAASNGGGIRNDWKAATTVENSTVSGNSAYLGYLGWGGGIHNYQRATLRLLNTTVAENTANEGPGIFNEWMSQLTLTNSLVANRCAWSSGAVGVSNGGNLESPGNTCGLTNPSDQVNVADARLLPLADYGGPTLTNGLLPDSPAVDRASSSSCPSVDQRGYRRPADGNWDGSIACDVGAFELGASEGPTLKVAPTKGGNAGGVSVTVNGWGFRSGATVRLTRSGYPDIIGEPTLVNVDGFNIQTYFDLIGASPGIWNVLVANSDGGETTLDSGFLVEQGGEPRLWLDLVGRDRIRIGRESLFSINVGNLGNVDSPAVLLLSLPEGMQIHAADRQDDTSGRSRPEPRVKEASGAGLAGFISRSIAPGQVLTMQFGITPAVVGSIELKSSIITLPPPTTDPRPLGGVAGWLRPSVVTVFTQNGFPEVDKPNLADILLGAIAPTFPAGVEFRSFFEISHDVTEYIIEHQSSLGVSFPDPDAIRNNKPGELEADFEQQTDVSKKDREADKQVQAATSIDPNDKACPAGYGEQRYISPGQAFQFTVYFENLESATLPAEDIQITDTLDSNLEPLSFQFGESSHPSVLDLSYDPTVNTATWTFRGINLPPNVNPPEGEGWVTFTVRPKQGLPTGTQIKNKATIDFEIGYPPDPMDTPEVFNTIDADVPTSNVLSLPATQTKKSFPVRWTGQDIGAGVASYSIYVSDNNGPYTAWLSDVTTTTDTYPGVANHTYRFYSRAKDGVGNIEDAPAIPDATTKVGGCAGTGLLAPVGLGLLALLPRVRSSRFFVKGRKTQ